MSKKYLYYFSEGNDAFGGDKVTMKNTLGGKGAGLAEMTAAGMPVPQGFTITTDACTQYYADGRQINDDITADIFEHLKGLEEITGKKFGDPPPGVPGNAGGGGTGRSGKRLCVDLPTIR